jgi:haloacetate dehalogenase
MQVLWGERGAIARIYDVLATWRERGANVYGKGLPGGHWLPEECPEQLAADLQEFLA